MNIRSTLCTAIPLFLLPACGGGSGGGSHGMPPSALQYSESFSVYMVDAAHAPLSASVAGSVTNWDVTPALPSGLSLDPQSGDIVGTPVDATPRRSYTIRASNHSGFVETAIELSVEQPERYAYVTCPDDRTITILGIDAGSGTVSRRGFVVAQAWEGRPECFQANPAHPFGYSTTPEGVLTTWSLDPASGWLSEIDALAMDTGPHSLAATPDGRFLFVVNQNGNDVSVYRADAGNGLLVQLGTGVAVAAQPVAIALDASGTRVAIASQGDSISGVGSALTLFTLDAATGEMTPAATMLLNGAKPDSLAFAPRQDVLYVSLPQVTRLLAVTFDIANATMASLGSAASGAGCGAVAVDPLGAHVWAANQSAGTLARFSVQPNGGVVALGSIPSGSAPAVLVMEPLGRFLFSLDSQTQELGLYDLDAQSGTPAHRTGWLTRGHPVHVAFGLGAHALGTSNFEMLTAATESNQLFAHPVDDASGALGQGVAIPTGSGPASVAADPRQRFAFTGNALDSTIGRYRIDAQTGALTELQPPLHTTGKPICVANDASGRFLYVALREVSNPTDGFLNTYSIDQTSGALTLLGSVATGLEPNWLGTDPTGQFLYVANTGDGSPGSATIAVFRLGAASGLPTGSALQQQAPGVWSLAFHPSGRYLYAALRTSNSAMPFQINPNDGSLSPTDGGVQTGTEPVSVAVTPDGRFAYIAYLNGGGSGTIGLFEIDPSTGVLVPPASPYLDGVAPADLVIDNSGRFLYSANSGTDTISAFSIGTSDGSLQSLTPAPAGLSPTALLLLQRWL